MIRLKKKLFFLVLGGFLAFGNVSIHAQNIRINEVMSANSSVIHDAYGNYDDWIELYNPGNNPVNTGGLYLTDDLNKLVGCQISTHYPDSTTLPAHGYKLFWADGEAHQGIFHLDFKLTKSGETIFLVKVDGPLKTILDSLTFPDILKNLSYGRMPDGSQTSQVFTQPTPRTANTSAGQFLLMPPGLSDPPGWYSEDFILTISSTNANDTIYYTLDGSIPNRSDHRYTSPILIRNRTAEPNGISTIRTTVDQGFYYWRLPPKSVEKGTVLRVRAFRGNDRPSEVVTSSYFVDPKKEQRYTFPVVSLVTDSLNFFSADSGILIGGNGYDGTDWRTANFSQEGEEWERLTHFEYFSKEGDLEISQETGVRIAGNASVSNCIKSLRLYARSEYGHNTFDYPIFPHRNYSQPKRITFRMTGNDAPQAYMRDVLGQSLVHDLPLDWMDYEPTVLFLNGEYWGIYNIREKHDEFFLQDMYDLDPNEVDILQRNHEVIEGSDEHYNAMIDCIRTHDMSNNVELARVDTMMDLNNFLDYIILEYYVNNGDWPYNNIKYWRKKTTRFDPNAQMGHDGRWRWFVYDLDYGFGRTDGPEFNTFNKTFTTVGSWQSALIRNLLGDGTLPGNAAYRQEFISRFADALNTRYHPDRVVKVVENRRLILEPEMQDHMDRWGNIASFTAWDYRIGIIHNFLTFRAGFIRKHLLDLFPEISDTVQLTFDVSDASKGTVYVNSTEINPYTFGVSPTSAYPWSGIFFKEIPITITAKPKLGSVFVRWSHDGSTNPSLTLIPSANQRIEAVFESNTDFYDLVINEINYNAPAEMGGDQEREFIEIFNPGTKPILLGGYHFSRGITFTFPAGSTLPAGGYGIIAQKSSNFEQLGVPVWQWNNGKLINTGENLVIVNPAGETVDSVRYSNQEPWPLGAEGTGFTIELSKATEDNSIPQYWYRSFSGGGTPGRVNSSTPDITHLHINEIYASDIPDYQDEHGEGEDWIEIYNNTANTVNMAGLWISDDYRDPHKFIIPPFFPDSVTIPAYGFLVLFADNNPKQGVRHLGFKLSKYGETIILTHPDGHSLLDSLQYPIELRTYSFGRFPDGAEARYQFEIPTPEKPNKLEGIDFGHVRLNEVMPKNYETWATLDGQYTDYIELYNSGDQDIQTSNFYLSTDPENPGLFPIEWSKPDSTRLKSKGYLLFYADDQPQFGVNHLAFTLLSRGGFLGLYYRQGNDFLIIDSVNYPSTEEGMVFQRFPDGSGSWSLTFRESPGAPNLGQVQPLENILINEFSAKNYETYLDPHGRYEDWIEFYNGNNYPVNLAGMSIALDSLNGQRWTIPESAPDSTTIPAHGRLLFWADDQTWPSVMNLGIRFRSRGGKIIISHQLQINQIHLLDEVTYPNQEEGDSYGRCPDGGDTWMQFIESTPGKVNKCSLSSDLLANLSSLQVFPNPASNHLVITGIDSYIGVIRIVNSLGNIVFHQNINLMDMDFDGSSILVELPKGLTSGLYYLIILNQENKKMIKLLIE